MRMRKPRVVTALVALAALASAPAAADPVRTPRAGAPALQIDAPSGWKVRRMDLLGLSFAAAYLDVRGGLVAIAMLQSRDAAPSLRDLAQRLAGRPMGLEFQASPASLDGRTAEAFTTTQSAKGSQPERHERYLISRIDDHHVAAVVSVTTAGEPEAERKMIEDAASGVRLVAADPGAK